MTEPYVPDPRLSDRANAKMRDLHETGRALTFSDLFGILEPHPDNPDCPSEWSTDGPQCQLPNHHDGPHRAELEW